MRFQDSAVNGKHLASDFAVKYGECRGGILDCNLVVAQANERAILEIKSPKTD
jgi:hypothetical protein